jgi:hypothetical protein
LASRTTSALLRGHLAFQARRTNPTSTVHPSLGSLSILYWSRIGKIATFMGEPLQFWI